MYTGPDDWVGPRHNEKGKDPLWPSTTYAAAKISADLSNAELLSVTTKPQSKVCLKNKH